MSLSVSDMITDIVQSGDKIEKPVNFNQQCKWDKTDKGCTRDDCRFNIHTNPNSKKCKSKSEAKPQTNPKSNPKAKSVKFVEQPKIEVIDDDLEPTEKAPEPTKQNVPSSSRENDYNTLLREIRNLEKNNRDLQRNNNDTIKINLNLENQLSKVSKLLEETAESLKETKGHLDTLTARQKETTTHVQNIHTKIDKDKTIISTSDLLFGGIACITVGFSIYGICKNLFGSSDD
jgi:hypothetical protein